MKNLSNKFDSAIEVEVIVEYSIDPADPECGINTTGMIIENVMLAGIDLLPGLSEKEINALEDEAYEDWSDDGSDYGDWLYEQEKDRRMDADCNKNWKWNND